MLSLARTLTVIACCLAAVPSQSCLVGDDGFNTGCCAPVSPNLPDFPAFLEDGRTACLRDCALEADYQVDVGIGVPNFVLEDLALMTVTVNPTQPGAPALGGVLIAKYARTWLEPAGSLLQKQVWRFLVNGNLTYTTAGTSIPCPTPACSGAGVRPHFVGHVDYICRSAAGLDEWRIAVSLHHLPGVVSHAAWCADSLTGPDAHDDRSYHIVAPGSFTFATVPEIQGSLVAESVRESHLELSPFTYQVFGEAHVQQAQLTTNLQACIGGGGTTATPYVSQTLVGAAGCNGVGSTFNSVNVGGTPFANGMIALRLGRWDWPGGWPGPTNLMVYLGVLQYQANCVPTAPPFQIVTGVGTAGVVAKNLFPGPSGIVPPPARGFIDLQNQELLWSGGARFGALAVPTQAFALNNQ